MKNLPNTDSVYATIGDYPVVDQFDVLYTSLLSGTYSDNYITGSMFYYQQLGPIQYSILIEGSRGLAFSRLNKQNFNSYPSPQVSSYNVQPWGERSGFLRNTRFFSSSERYYDSFTPEYSKMVEATGGNIEPVNSIGSTRAQIRLGGDDPADTESWDAVGFSESFPFESKFSEIERVKKIKSDYKGLPLSIVYSVVNYPFDQYWFDAVVADIKQKDIASLLYGFGDASYRKEDATAPGTYYGSKYLLNSRYSTVGGSGETYKISPVVRGWKYGLIDANPHYTSAVFRRSHFGQFRDMLEQRPTAVTLEDPENSPMVYFGPVEQIATPVPATLQKTSATPDFTVKASFLKQDVIAKKLVYLTQAPENTWSSNLSTYLTSSLPYTDGQSSNRGEITAGNVPSSISLIVSTDPFGNITLLP